MLKNLRREEIDFCARYKEKLNEEPPAQLKSIIPEHRILFDLENVDNSVANAIRRCILEETETKVMTFELEDFETNSLLVRSNTVNIRNRLQLIKIDQSVDDSAIFSLDVINKTNESFKYIYASELKGPKIFDENFTIFTLNPGEYIKIKRIYIKLGYGYDAACFMTPFKFRYTTTDYIPMNYVMDKGVVVSVLVKNDPKYNGKRVLINPASNHNTPELAELINEKQYDLIIREHVEFYPTDTISPRNYSLSFCFVNHTDGIKYLRLCIKTLIIKLEEAAKMEHHERDGETLSVYLPLETATIGLLITQACDDIKKNMKNVSMFRPNQTELGVKIKIADLDAEKVYKAACAERIKLFESMLLSTK
jgi:DNA-directed RNA polymerase subunit L